MSSLVGTRFNTRLESPLFVIEFDTTPREVHTGSTTPTDHPIEDGAVVTDHAIEQPLEIELQGVITSRPITVLASERTTSFMANGLDGRPESAWDRIRLLRTSKQLVSVFTELREYSNMMIVSDSVTRDARTGRVLDISLRLREIRLATVETTDAPEPTDPVDKPTPDLGPKQTKPAPPRVETKAAETASEGSGSWASSVANAIGGTPQALR